MRQIIQKAFFAVRYRLVGKLFGKLRHFYFSAAGMRVGKGTTLPSITVNWPHKVKIGDYCELEENISFKIDGIWQDEAFIQIGNNVFIGSGTEFNIKHGIAIGDDCLIASGCRFIDHDHGIETTNLMRMQPCTGKEIIIENNVWIGANVVILKGITIASGAIVAAGAVVTKSISANEIWGGVPAKKISIRV